VSVRYWMSCKRRAESGTGAGERLHTTSNYSSVGGETDQTSTDQLAAMALSLSLGFRSFPLHISVALSCHSPVKSRGLLLNSPGDLKL